MSYFDLSLCAHSDIEVALKFDAAMERYQAYCNGISRLLNEIKQRKAEVESQIMASTIQSNAQSSHHLKILNDELFELKVKETQNVEMIEMIEIRSSQYKTCNQDPIMVEQQEMIIADAYKESNYLRAKLLHSYTSSSHILGANVILYIQINQIERKSHQKYIQIFLF